MKRITAVSTQRFASLLLMLTIVLTPNLSAQKKSTPAAPAKSAPAKTAAKPSAAATSSGIAGKGAATAPAKAPITTANRGNVTASAAATGTKTTTFTHVGGLPAVAPIGSRDRVSHDGKSEVRVRAGGRPSDVSFHGRNGTMAIHNNLAGGKKLEVENADHTRLSYDRGRRSFIAHLYSYHGHGFYRRSYYYQGRAYNRFYNNYGYRGLYLDVYAPYQFYGAGFYGWAYNPWGVPVNYAWGFGAAPWYGYYGGYFAPYPTYAAPSLWLTDYLISQSLAAGYQAGLANQGQAESAGTAPSTPLTPEAKQLVADEIRGQIALENAEAQNNAQHLDVDPASSSIARMLSDGQSHVFVAGQEMDVTDSTGRECAVTEGDVLQLRSAPAADATWANLVVIAGKGGAECRSQAIVAVPLEELQELQNHMRETTDQGMVELQAKQGTLGLPPAPPSAIAPPVKAEIAQNAPPPDPAGAQAIEQQAKVSEQFERQVVAGIASPSGLDDQVSATSALSAPPTPQAASANIALGQTPTDVTSAIGQPLRILNLGPKTVYVYKDMKMRRG